MPMVAASRPDDQGPVLGIDGWRRGWIGIRLDGPEVRAVQAKTLLELAQLAGPVAMVGIDIPLHLPTGPDPRPAEVAARAVLKRRASTLFTTMHMDCLAAEDYAQANRISAHRTGRKISKQAWNLVPRIREARSVARASSTPMIEVHPELSFLHMADGATPLSPKKTWAGQAERLAALFAAGIELDALDSEVIGAVPVDDVLDAAAVAWSARRVATDSGTRYPLPADPSLTVSPPDLNRLDAIWA